jgi:hypothetical protein
MKIKKINFKYILFSFFLGCCLVIEDTDWNYSALSPTKTFSYNVQEIGRSYRVLLLDNDNNVCYADPEEYRMRDRFYITWDKKKDILWVYSSDIGIFYFYQNQNRWERNSFSDEMQNDFYLPEVINKMLPEGSRSVNY